MQQFKCVLMGILILVAACKKDNYYKDSGSHDPHFKGSTLDYLDSVPFYFDSVAAVVRLAGMEEVFKNDTLTFFAPTDKSILNLVKELNYSLYTLGYDTVKVLADVPSDIWQKYLQMYMFHGASQLKDYPQIDYNLKAVYPGQGYLSWNGTPMNIGVVYNDDNGVKYVGYRQLSIAYIPDPARPLDNWYTEFIASSNLVTDNGVVHTLNVNHRYFGFSVSRFIADMQNAMQNGG
ncbi:hypothetical protein SAMN05518672_104762 [Chitinophaga sp. CF118]|uniref:hypothetical protein n=1 Tax=Chitinophaga sp. CF118 TaxID=1884367 RepID=UPI0008ED5133|nr:hypothetical protein [Chitinophaga sp. CF118]SFE17461.1 hypothetical protein SAMN05518672_104762 [Chitinophaga sp. CF118]